MDDGTDDWSSYSFRSSLVDIPLISFVRSLAAICKSLFCLVWSLLAFSFSMFDLFVVVCTTLCTSFLELG